ncbi:MAG: substrate-binding domain-containing protein [Ignisphaera sp.]
MRSKNIMKMGWIVAIFVIAIVSGFIYYTHRSSEKSIIKIATTTSLYITGLLDYLSTEFSKKYSNVELVFIAVGTGQALKLAAKGDVCGVIVHDPNLEKLYIDKGVLEYRKIFAYNFFIIVGPRDDPANVSKAKSIEEAFKRIYNSKLSMKILFVSRGDSSGTHIRELIIWRKAGLNPNNESWYLSCGCSMGQALLIANEKKAYTLSDIATFMIYKKAGRIPNLDILYHNTSDYYTINIYSGYISKNCRDEERNYVINFLDFIYENQSLIETYSLDKNNLPIFYPIAEREEEIKKLWEVLSESYQDVVKNG